MADALVRPSGLVAEGTAKATAGAPAAAIRRRTLSSPVPAHVAVVFGLASAGYAVTLAGVSALQATSDTAILERRAPADLAIREAAARHDRARSALEAASREYEDTVARYGDAADRLTAIEDEVRRLAAAVAALDGQTRALPARLALPPVVRSAPRSSTSTSHATSGGSAP